MDVNSNLKHSRLPNTPLSLAITRRCVGVDTIIRRWQKLTGGAATHAGTGRTFDDLAHEAEAADSG